MGDSDKLDASGPGSYTFLEHRRYLDELFDALDLGDRITFVVHDCSAELIGAAIAGWITSNRDERHQEASHGN